MLRVVLVAAAVVLLCGPVSAAPNVVSTNYAASSTAGECTDFPYFFITLYSTLSST